MLISKKGLLYFAIVIKINWLVMVLFYHPVFMALCFALAIIGLLMFVQSNLKQVLSIALLGWSLDCIWHISGIITFANSELLPVWLLSIWLVYSVFIVYFFERFKRFYIWIPIVFALLNLSSFLIGVKIGDSVIHNPIYYLATLLGWSLLGLIVLNLNKLKYSSENQLKQQR